MGCFTTGTQIIMKDDTVKNIENIEIGDIVKSFGLDTNSIVNSKVTETFVHSDHEGYLVINGNIKTTVNHPFYSNGKWIEAGSLKINDSILHADGLYHTVEIIEIYDENVDVYNIEVGGTHNYFAEGYLVHNKCFRSRVKVLLEDGSLKNIEDIEIGEKLIGKDGEINEVIDFHRPTLGQFNDKLSTPLKMTSINGGGFDVSQDHIFMTSDGWKTPTAEKCKILHSNVLESEGIEDIKDLQIGDKIVTPNGLEEVTSIEFKNEDSDLQLYNFVLKGSKTYYVVMDGHDKPMLVHNKGPGECFMADQKILMADNTFKRIDEIVVGDEVKVYNVELKEVKDSIVNKIKTKLHSDVYELTLENGKVLKPTGNHPIWTNDKGWTTVDGHNPNHAGGSGYLEIGDYVYDIIDDWVRVDEIVSVEGEHLTYNFVDMEYGTIIADNIVTHNSSFGVEESVTISGSLDNLYRVSHGDMQVGDKVLAANIEGLPDSDIAEEFLLWEYTGSIADAITFVTASIESLTPSSHSEWLVMDCDNGRDDTFKITPDHPLLAKSGSIWAFEYPGDIDTSYKLVSSSLEEVSINSITSVTSSIDTGSFMRFDIEPQDTYFSDDILVHN